MTMRKNSNRMNGRKRLPAAAIALLLAGCMSCSLFAAEDTSDDLQQTKTETENLTETETEIETEAETGIETEAVIETEDMSEEEEETKAGYTKVKAFIADVEAAVNDRTALSQSYSEAELSMMTNDEIAEANQECCESERWMINVYGNANFRRPNMQYLCEQYLTGLQNQLDAYESWKEKQDIDAYNELWEAGYAKRAAVVVELADYYGAQFTDISDMRAKVKDLEALDEFSSGTVSEATTRTVQECLNTLKFPVGKVDGYCGYRTIQMIRRFQKLCGYTPADGIIDDELVQQLQQEVEKISPKKEEVPETEPETESGPETETETEQAAETETETE